MAETPEFVEFQKIARLIRPCVMTEKIDGTNALVHVLDDGTVLAGSRSRYITPEADNFGFAKWVKEHEDELRTLGAGKHHGEWWGSGIQRGYGLKNGEKRFSLFAVHRWGAIRDKAKFPAEPPACCSVVPVLYEGPFCTTEAQVVIEELAELGSRAAKGFMDPEGIVVFHSASQALFKMTIKGDEVPKSLKR